MTPQPTARFDLLDHHGQPVTGADFRGQHLLVYFGFTHCRVVCPRTLTTLTRALDLLGQHADRITALYVTTDPERDTPTVMRTYLADSHPRFTGLTGTAEQVESAKAAFRVFAERRPDPEDPDGYAVPHSAIAYLMAPDGSYLAHFLDGTTPEQIADRTLTHLQPVGSPS